MTSWSPDSVSLIRRILLRWSHQTYAGPFRSWVDATKASRMEERFREAGDALFKPADQRTQIDDDAIIRWAAALPLFKGVDRTIVAHMFQSAVIRTSPRPEALFVQNQVGDNYYILFRGGVNLYCQDDAVTLANFVDDEPALFQRVIALAGEDADVATEIHADSAAAGATDSSKERLQAGRAALGMHVACLRTRGGGFGELSLFEPKGRRNCTGVATAGAEIIVVPREAYARSVMPVHRARMDVATRINALKALPLFRGWRDAPLKAVAYVMRRCKFAKGKCIFKQNTRADVLLLIRSGEVQVACRPLRGSDNPGFAGSTMVPPKQAEVPVALVGASDMVGEETILELLPGAAAPAAQSELPPRRPGSSSQPHSRRLGEAAKQNEAQQSRASVRRPRLRTNSSPQPSTRRLSTTPEASTPDEKQLQARLQARAQAQTNSDSRTKTNLWPYSIYAVKEVEAYLLDADHLSVFLRGARGTQTVETIRATGLARRSLRQQRLDSSSSETVQRLSMRKRFNSFSNLASLSSLIRDDKALGGSKSTSVRLRRTPSFSTTGKSLARQFSAEHGGGGGVMTTALTPIEQAMAAAVATAQRTLGSGPGTSPSLAADLPTIAVRVESSPKGLGSPMASPSEHARARSTDTKCTVAAAKADAVDDVAGAKISPEALRDFVRPGLGSRPSTSSSLRDASGFGGRRPSTSSSSLRAASGFSHRQ